MRILLNILATALIVLACTHMACAAPADDYSQYSVRKGKLFLGNTPVPKSAPDDLDAVDPSPQKVDPRHLTPEAIHYWSVFSLENAGPEEGTSWVVLFFSKQGKFMFSLPYNDWAGSWDAIPSPDGQKLFFGKAGYSGPEMEYTLYTIKDLKPLKTITCVRSSLEWIDSSRIAFTTLDEDAERPESAGPPIFPFCVMMHDTVTGQDTVIKAATDTQSFLLDNMDRAKGILNVREVSVDKNSDWNDSEKEKEGTIKITIPARN